MTSNTSDFEHEFRLEPLGDDVESRIERVEAITAVLLRAFVKKEDTIIAGGRTVPVPSERGLELVLNEYRSAETAEAYESVRMAGIEAEIQSD